MIGAKTVTSSILLLVAAALGWYVGLSPARLASIGPTEAFWAGFFAFLAGGAVYRYWRLHERSARYFRYCTDEPEWVDEAHFVGGLERRILIGENEGEAYDFSPAVQYAIYVALAFWMGLITLDTRAVELIRTSPARLFEGSSEYCPEPELEKLEEVKDPGCALIKRAFALGYAKSLGPCEAKLEEQELKLCTLRQRDEPFLHFAWRRLGEFSTAAIENASPERLARMRTAFETRIDHMEELTAAQRFVLRSEARAAHHIFTNLPDPGGFLTTDADCDERYRALPPRILAREEDPLQASRELDHILGQLLFDTRYAPAAGSCREYTVHWGAPADACEQLEKDPVGFLEGEGIINEVRAVLERYRVTVELQRIAESLSAAEGMSALSSILASVPPRRFVSFHCYIEEERTEAASASRVLWLGQDTFVAVETRVPKLAPGEKIGAGRYHQVASMLAPAFHYGSLLSQVSPGEVLDTGVKADFFQKRYGYLSQLDYLTDVDIFLGTDWVEQREDILEVYPYHVHLQNYVEMFRVRYRAERGRL